MITTTTFTGAPRADRFRQGDFWAGPDGRHYRVMRGLGEGSCCLIPTGRGGARLYLRREWVQGFRRIHWGGQA